MALLEQQRSSAIHVHAQARSRGDIPVYTGPIKIVKVRRVGNSNVVSIPREFEASGYTPGSFVLVEDLGGGELRILPTDKVREGVRQVADRIVEEHSAAMGILANSGPDDDN